MKFADNFFLIFTHLTLHRLHNGQPLQPANRITTNNDFGYVSLDINKAKISDTGTYTCVLQNAKGRATNEINLTVQPEVIVYEEKTERYSSAAQYSPYEPESSEYFKSPPVFLKSLDPKGVYVSEGRGIQLEATLQSNVVGVKSVTWTKDGRPLTIGM